jgi:hypothetical protein
MVIVVIGNVYQRLGRVKGRRRRRFSLEYGLKRLEGRVLEGGRLWSGARGYEGGGKRDLIN